MSGLSPGSLRTSKTIELLGITRRQLQYWVKAGLGPDPAQEAPQWHNFKFRDLLVLKVISILRASGNSAQKCWVPLADFKKLLANTDDETLEKLTFFCSTRAISAIWSTSEPHLYANGQLVLSVRGFRRQVDSFRRRKGAA